ncbi:TIGR03986 family CRISPR-associated RAMP protein [bacterium endosymbiont of Escarpia laminata]|nr:MAG: TIGR03986 family CRISPR-associated RAMP protein [bacterium endosymbiont of Escarpia laminata]
MSDFHNPYHFVPMRGKTGQEAAGWTDAKPHNDRASHPYFPGGHSRYAKGHHHGHITCTLTTETPIFIGATRYQEASDDHPARIAPYELGSQPAIPATSLRGMISSIAEAASHSAMRVLDAARPMSYRLPTEKAYRSIGMVLARKNGALVVRDLTEQEKTKLATTQNIMLDDQHIQLKKLALSGSAALEKFYYQAATQKEVFYSTTAEGRIRGKFRVMDARSRNFPSAGKHRDFFIAIPERIDGIYELPEGVVEQFYVMADDAGERANKPSMRAEELIPYHPLGTRRNDAPQKYGDKIRLGVGDLVYFSKDGNQITALSLSAIWRGSRGGLGAFIQDKELLAFHQERKHLSPAERVFGFVEDRPSGHTKRKDKEREKMAAAYAGHVRFSAAKWDGRLPQGTDSAYMDEVTLKILDSPKPPSPALYFRNKGEQSGYIAKSKLDPEKHEPQGRKFYLHKKKDDKEPWRTHPKNEQERLKQKSRITPLRERLKFTFAVEFDNLTNFELGMLLYALSPKDSFRHKIGMGKPLGLGSVKIHIDKVVTSDRMKRYKEAGPFAKPSTDNAEVDWKKIRDEFIKKMMDIAPDAIRALALLGDPDKVTHPVRYPQIGKINDSPKEIPENEMEQENYRWWVVNDGKANSKQKVKRGGEWVPKYTYGPMRKHLEPLDKSIEKLPVLPRNPFAK